MITITIFSKNGIDFIRFHCEFHSEIETILSLESKTIRNLELQDGVIVGELESRVEGDG